MKKQDQKCEICGRDVYVKDESKCVFHSEDENNSEDFEKEFWREFEITTKVIKGEEVRVLDYRDSDTKREEKCLEFEGFIFPEGFLVDFSNATFSKEVNFRRATFSSEADFSNATFSGEADFATATFSGEADFSNATFSGGVYFSEATFSEKVHFLDAKFLESANFLGVTFSGEADFYRTEFSKKENTYTYFHRATFSEKADFSGATFPREAYFSWATFSEKADFSGATFSEKADFSDTEFHNEVTFKGTDKDRVFSKNHLTSFQRAKFEKPEKVGFTSVDLSRVSFLYADIKDVQFLDVDWHPKSIVSLIFVAFAISVLVSLFATFFALLFTSTFISLLALLGISPYIPLLALGVISLLATFFALLFMSRLGRSGTRLAIYDEIEETEKHDVNINKNTRNRITKYTLISNLYKQLRYNYEKSLRYSEDAGDFYIGEMEMRRLISKEENNLDFILLSIYQVLSYYGERWWMPLLWSGWVIALFSFVIALLYGSPCENCMNVVDASILTSILTFLQQSVDSTFIQGGVEKTVDFSKTYWGIAERLTSIVLVTMFVLAIRRKFTR